ncbi:uncharacterized protein [Haliotis asinina]|uniref:uncharacterized protein isoform X2 n=1 Tax=Haliotis asinina TaxID=109174 RepID=UPI0035327DE1
MLCPELAKPPPPIIITANNVDDVRVSTYQRDPGTRVTVTCFVASSYTLIGDNVLTCLSNGSWDKPVPRCVPTTRSTPAPPITTVPSATTGDLTLLPLMVGAGLAALVCLFLAILMCCAAYFWRRDNRKQTHTEKRSPSPGTMTTEIYDSRNVTFDDFSRESWRSPPPTIGSSDRRVAHDQRIPRQPDPTWFYMLPRKSEVVVPYFRSPYPGTMTTGIYDNRIIAYDDFSSESWGSYPPPVTMATIGSKHRLVSHDLRTTRQHNLTWFSMLPKNNDVIAPYV